jgi:hypothetical protein
MSKSKSPPAAIPPRHPLVEARRLIELAEIYVADGAFYTAAARLRSAADVLDAHAKACDPRLQQEG